MNLHRNHVRANETKLEALNNIVNLNDFKVADTTNDFNVGDAIESFLRGKEKRNINTYRSYKTDVKHFFENCFGKPYKDIRFNELNSEITDFENLVEYFNGLFEKTDQNGKRVFSNNTINKKQTSIKQLLKYLKIKKVLVKDLTNLEYIEQLPKDTDSIEMIPFEEALKYAEWFKKNEVDRGIEKYIITKLAIDTGLRASELVKLTWSQFTIDSDIVIMRGIGKGNKKWVEKISLEFYHEIIEELKPIEATGDDKVFTIKYHALPNMMNRAKIALKHQGKKYTFHSFKKTSVNMAYRLTGDILEAQRKGRHSSLDTTRIYTQAEDYGMTGLISLGGEIPNDLFKTVDQDVLLEALEEVNKDFLFILNYKINEKLKNKIQKTSFIEIESID